MPYVGGSGVERPPSVCLCVFGVLGVWNPPANEKALCRVWPYCLLRAGPFVSYCHNVYHINVDITE